MTTDETYVVPDTNIFYHYRFFTDLPWGKECGAKSVKVLITLPVLQELDRHKEDPGKPRRQDLARRVLSRLSPIFEGQADPTLRPGEEVSLAASEPKTSIFAEFELDKERWDDRLLALILQRKQQDPSARYVVYSGDLNVRLKARTLGIEIVVPSETLRIPGEPDPRDQEIKKLRQELLTERNVQPKLDVLVNGAAADKQLLFQMRSVSPLSPEELRSQLAAEHAVLSAPLQPRPGENGIAAALMAPSGQEVQRYHVDVDRYKPLIERYFHEAHAHGSVAERTLQLAITIENSGRGPATDVDLFLCVPSVVKVFESRREITPPKRPTRPVPPKSHQQLLAEQLSASLPQHNLAALVPTLLPPTNDAPPSTTGPDVRLRDDGWEVNYWVRSLKHGLSVAFRPIYFLFPAKWSDEELTAEYVIRCGNRPEPIEGAITIRTPRTD